MSHYTVRTLKLLRDLGWECQVVEKWQMHSKRRIDLFGIIDIVAMKSAKSFGTEGFILGVQSTSYAGRKAHMDKINNSDKTIKWLNSGGLFWLITWKKKKIKRGGKAFRYEPVIDKFTSYRDSFTASQT